MYNLVKFNCLADELEVSGFSLMSDNQLYEYKELVKKLPETFEFYISANNYVELTPQEFNANLFIRPITVEAYQLLHELFDSEYGFFPCNEALLSIIAESEDDDLDSLWDGDLDSDYDDEEEEAY